jgi:hypothetical protein
MLTTRGGGRRRRGLVSGAIVLVAASQLAFSCQRPPGCEMPFSPVGGDQDRIGQEPSGVWPVPASATYRPIPPGPLDTDGDGVADTSASEDEGRSLVIHRSSGNLTLTVDAPATIGSDYPEGLRAGDVDGDGRGDLLVALQTRPSEYATDRPDVIYHLVSGATPNGVHLLSEVAALLVPATADHPFLVPLGDVDGDGRGELANVQFASETRPEETWTIWRGAELDLTPGAHQPQPSLPPPDGQLIGPVALDGRSALAVNQGQNDDRSYDILLWLPEGGLTFTTGGVLPVTQTSPIGGGTVPGQIRVADDGRDRWLVASFADRGGGQRWAWDLDHLCANTPPAPIED